MQTDLPHHGLPAGPSGHISRLGDDGWTSAVFWQRAIVKTGFPHGDVKLHYLFLFSLQHIFGFKLANAKGSRTSTCSSSHFEVYLIHQCDDEGVEISQEEGKNATQLPLQGNTRVVVLQGADDIKQHGAEHSQ